MSVCRRDCKGLRMSQLVRSPSRWPVMILIPGGRSVGRALQRVRIATLWLAHSLKSLVIPEPRLCGCSGPVHHRADAVRIDRRRSSSETPTGGRCFPNLNQAPPLARHRGKISSPNRLSAPLKLLSRAGKAFLSRKGGQQPASPRRFFKEHELQLSLPVTDAASEDIAWHCGAAS